MSRLGEQRLAEELALPPMERVEMVEKLLSSFDFTSRKEIDELWVKEAKAALKPMNVVKSSQSLQGSV